MLQLKAANRIMVRSSQALIRIAKKLCQFAAC